MIADIAKFLMFQGRISRSDWWILMVLATGLGVVSSVFWEYSAEQRESVVWLAAFISGISSIWISLAAMFCRMRDRNWKWWGTLLMILSIPTPLVLFTGIALLLICGFFGSEEFFGSLEETTES